PKTSMRAGSAQAKASADAALVWLGGGSLRATRPTAVEWEFRNAAGSAKQGHRKYSRNVEYTGFQFATDRITLHLQPLNGSSSKARTLTFTSKGQPDVTIWIGNGTEDDFSFLLTNAEPRCFSPGAHFEILHKIVGGVDAIPTPMSKVC